MPLSTKAYPNTLYKGISFNTINPPANNLADYTLLVYMIGSDLEAKSYAATKNIQQMENPGSSSKINVIVETGGGTNQTKLNDKRFIDFTVVQRHKILHNKVQTLVNLGKKDMGNPKTLSDFIVWAISNFPAKKYAVVLWDHGSGLNGFGQDPNFHNDILTPVELKQSFLRSEFVTNTKFELIGFDACAMSSLEVATRLQNATHYMVASEEVEPTWGWNYTAIIQNLSADSSQSGSSLGKVIVDSYLRSSKHLSTVEDFGADKEITLAVIDMSKTSGLIRAVNTLSSAIVSNIYDLPSAIRLSKSIESTEHYGQSALGSSGFVDLSDLLINVKEKYPFLSAEANSVRNLINAAIIYKFAGEARPSANGLSVYMPLLRNEYSNSSELFVISPEWLNLLYSQRSMITTDNSPPIIKSTREGNIVRASVYGSDIANVYSQIVTNSSKGHNLMYIQSIEPSSSIDSHGYFQYKQPRILVVCNETKCVPASVRFQSDGERKYAFIPVRLESSNGRINQDNDLSLIYEVDKDGKFVFLGARPEVNPQKTIPKEWFGLASHDKIFFKGLLSIARPSGVADLSEQVLSNSTDAKDSKGPLLVDNPDRITPRYINSTVPFSISFLMCDYSDNCDKTRWYSFNREKSPIFPQKLESGYDYVPKKLPTSSEANANFSTYINPTFGIKLQYPSDWIENRQDIYDNNSVSDDNLADPAVVSFSPSKPFSSEGNLPTSFSVTATDWPFKDSPRYYFDFFNNTDNQKKMLANNVEIIHTNTSTIAGYPAFEFTFRYKSLPEQTLGIAKGERMEQTTTILMNHRMYNLDFASYLSQFNHYLPIIDTIKNSFRPYINQNIATNSSSYNHSTNSSVIRAANENTLPKTNNIRTSEVKGSSTMTNTVARTSTISYANYTDPIYRYNISYPFYPGVGGPISLKTVNPNLRGQVFTLNSNASRSAQASDSVNLIITAFQKNETQQMKNPPIILSSSGLRTFDITGIISNINSKISSLKSFLLNFRVLNHSEIMFKNRPTYSVEYKYFNPVYKSPMQERTLSTIFDNHLFTFEYVAKPSNYYAYLPIFQKVINSFAVKGHTSSSTIYTK